MRRVLNMDSAPCGFGGFSNGRHNFPMSAEEPKLDSSTSEEDQDRVDDRSEDADIHGNQENHSEGNSEAGGLIIVTRRLEVENTERNNVQEEPDRRQQISEEDSFILAPGAVDIVPLEHSPIMFVLHPMQMAYIVSH